MDCEVVEYLGIYSGYVQSRRYPLNSMQSAIIWTNEREWLIERNDDRGRV